MGWGKRTGTAKVRKLVGQDKVSSVSEGKAKTRRGKAMRGKAGEGDGRGGEVRKGEERKRCKGTHHLRQAK